MKRQTGPTALELIHGAALCPAAWDGVLRRLASLTGCVAGGLTVERPATRQGMPLTFFGFDPDHVALSFDRYLPLNPLFEIEPRMQKGFVVANGDVVAPDEFRRSEFFNGWARPQGLCSPITVVIHRTKAAYVPLTLVRPDGAGEVTSKGRALLSRLAPHLVHAMDITVRLQASAAAAGSLEPMLEALPCGAVLIDQDRRILFANTAGLELLDASKQGLLTCISGRVAVRDPAADRRFQTAVAAALGQGVRPQASRMSLQAPPADAGPYHGQLLVRLAPIPRSENVWSVLGDETFGQARCLLLISAPDIVKLARDHALTPAEGRVLAAVALGKGLGAAASELGISRSTVHSHLDKIFQKTGTSRQAELVRLVQGGSGS